MTPLEIVIFITDCCLSCYFLGRIAEAREWKPLVDKWKKLSFDMLETLEKSTKLAKEAQDMVRGYNEDDSVQDLTLSEAIGLPVKVIKHGKN